MHHRFIAIRIHSIGPKFAMKDISMGVQNQPEVLSQSGELHFLDDIEGICTVLGSSFNDPMHDIVLVEYLIVAKSFL